MKWVVVILMVLSGAVSADADHDLDIYSFGNVFVYDVFVQGGRELRFVSLVDSTDLMVLGQVTTRSDYPLASYGHHEHFLLVTFRNRVEIYGVQDLRNPSLVQRISLTDGNLPRFRSWTRIAKVDERYFIFS